MEEAEVHGLSIRKKSSAKIHRDLTEGKYYTLFCFKDEKRVDCKQF